MTTRLSNAITRSLATLFPYAFTNQRHDFAKDYGWPEEVTFELLFRAAHRNGIARAAVDKTALRVWSSLPEVWESEEPKESTLEADIRQRFEDIHFWQACIEADRRAYIGGYSGLILRFADNKRFQDPVERVSGGIEGLVSAEPVWASQLVVTSWDTDETSDDYGKPQMYELRESGVTDNRTGKNSPPRRNIPVHPSRVLLWSRDGSVHARSDLEPGFNDLLDMEKIKGAGGEGFYKTAKAQPVIEVDPEARIEDMAQMMGVPVDGVKPAIDNEVTDWSLGFNASLLLAGMKATPLSITLPQPEEFFNTALRSFAASVGIPVRVLLGNETGERSSTQDQEDFDRVCMSRREQYIVPTLREFLNRLERFGLIQKKDYTIGWESLLDMSPDQKMERAERMARINQMVAADGGKAFEDAEIREEAGFDPAEVPEGSEDERVDEPEEDDAE